MSGDFIKAREAAVFTISLAISKRRVLTFSLSFPKLPLPNLSKIGVEPEPAKYLSMVSKFSTGKSTLSSPT